MPVDIFENFQWHSSIGIDCAMVWDKKFVTRIPNTAKSRGMFVAAGNDLLIHKTTKCLWKVSEDNKSIEPVFSNDVLTEDEVKLAMEE